MDSVNLMNNQLATAGEILKDSQLIFIAIGGLGSLCESFQTSITTHFDHSISFESFTDLLLDFESSLEQAPATEEVTIQVNVASKSSKGGESLSSGKATVICQICGKKNHNALNCFNRINVSKFPPQHNRQLSPMGPSYVKASPSAKYAGFVAAMSGWYHDTGSTHRLTPSISNIRFSSTLSDNSAPVITANGQYMTIVKSGNCRKMLWL